MKHKLLLVICFFLVATVAFADFVVLAENEIAQYIADRIMLELREPSDIYLELGAYEFSLPLENILKERLLNKDFTVYEELINTGLKLRVTYYPDFRTESVKTLVFRRRKSYIEHNFSYQVSQLHDAKILSFGNISVYETDSRNGNIGKRWYDTLLISLIVGGIAYLFYFGAK